MRRQKTTKNIELDAALSEGKLWRAKEILQGRISNLPYDPGLYEQYGSVLLAMGDLLEAGKYLFLSGIRKQEYDEAIQLFLSRYGRSNWNHLSSAFPSRVRSLPVEKLPQTTQRELRERGLAGRVLGVLEATPTKRKERRTGLKGTLANSFGLFIVLLVLTALVLGFARIVAYILALFR